MDKDTRVVITLLFTEHLRMRATELCKTPVVGGPAHALRAFTENFIDNLQSRGVHNAELEADFRQASGELEALLKDSEKAVFIPSLLPERSRRG